MEPSLKEEPAERCREAERPTNNAVPASPTVPSDIAGPPKALFQADTTWRFRFNLPGFHAEKGWSLRRPTNLRAGAAQVRPLTCLFLRYRYAIKAKISRST
jgi:hypothetical protein